MAFFFSLPILFRKLIVSGRESSFVDNVFRDKILCPAVGSVLVCDLTPFADHSGIYVGDGKIAHRSGNGYIEIVYPGQFLSRIDGFNNAISIYVACHNKYSIGNKQAAKRAIQAVSNPRHSGYDILNKNCHHFTRYCITGDTNQWGLDFTFTSLEHLLVSKFNLNQWRVWDFEHFDFKRKKKREATTQRYPTKKRYGKHTFSAKRH